MWAERNFLVKKDADELEVVCVLFNDKDEQSRLIETNWNMSVFASFWRVKRNLWMAQDLSSHVILLSGPSSSIVVLSFCSKFIMLSVSEPFSDPSLQCSGKYFLISPIIFSISSLSINLSIFEVVRRKPDYSEWDVFRVWINAHNVLGSHRAFLVPLCDKTYCEELNSTSRHRSYLIGVNVAKVIARMCHRLNKTA